LASTVSHDLQARVNRELRIHPSATNRIITYGEIRCPTTASVRPGSVLSCRTYGHLIDGSEEQNYYVRITVLDASGRVRYTIAPPSYYTPPPGAAPIPGFTPPPRAQARPQPQRRP
jgi:hypothetical protein